MTASPVITFEAVSKSFRGGDGHRIDAISGLSTTLPSGRMIALVGPDGAGKTTLLRLVVGLLVPTEGALRVLGHDAVGEVEAIRRKVGYMPQSFGLYEELSVEENLTLYADLQGVRGARRQARFDELLDFTSLAPFRRRLAGKLSGGMKQKLGLACTLVHPPQLLLLDEPSVGVDPLSRRELWEIVQGLIHEGMTVIWSTAYLDEAERSDAILVLDQGQLVYQGPPARFTARMRGRSFELRAPHARLRTVQRRLLEHPLLADAVLRGTTLRLVTRAPGAPPIAGLLTRDEQPEANLTPVSPVLEDAYVAALRPAAGQQQTADLPYAPPRFADAAAPIETRELVRRFGDFTAVDRVNLTVRRGEVFGLLGPNGAGKSTIFKMLCGLLPPTDGEARVAGIDLGRAAAQARERIGYMAQQFSLYGGLSVAQNLRFFSGVYGLWGRLSRARIAAVSREFELDRVANQTAASLPLGFKQRLSLACALLHEPAILFLDEPTSGVDPLTRREFWTRISAMAERGVTVMVTTHFMEEAEYCDRLAIIFEGREIALGSPEGLKREHGCDSIEAVFIHLITSQGEAEA